MAVSPILAIPEIAPTQTDKTTTMNSAIEAIEAATQDQLAVSFAGGNVTLTALQYTRHATFICSGLTADRDLVVPLTKRIFVVRNSSAHNVTVKGATGATVVVAAGDGAIIQNDGTDNVALASGGSGPTGATGLAGGAITIGYTFSATTTNSDPGGGILRLNAGTQNTATAIYLDLLAADTTDWTTVIDSLDDSTSTVKGHIRLFKLSDDSKWILFTLSALVSHTGYRELTVAVVAASSANPFSAADSLALAFDRTGNTGSTGATGATGSTGATGASTAWHDGTGVPSSGLGSTGDYYLNDANGDVYLKSASSPAWNVVANIGMTPRNAGVMLAQWVLGTIAANGDFYFAYKTPYAGSVTSLDSLSTTGTFTVNVKINGSSVTSLSAVAVSTAANTAATGANTFSAGDTITGTISSASGSPTDAVLSLNVTWS